MTRTGKYKYRGVFRCPDRVITLTTRADSIDWTKRDFLSQLARWLGKDLTEVDTMMFNGAIQSKVNKVEEGTLCEDRDRKGGYLVL